MLEEISISDLGVIKRARLPFSEGLTVITGETGAGKTMVLSALQLLMGKRSDASIVRHGSSFASVEGCWNVENLSIVPAVIETGAVIEDNVLYINRTVKSDGKSRAVLGGKSTPASILSNIGSGLVNIHGQSDQIRLKNNAAQLEALDKFSGEELSKALSIYQDAFREWSNLVSIVRDVKNNAESRKREYRDLKRFLKDFNELDPQKDEDETLEKEITLLENAEKIRKQVTESLAIINPDNYEIQSIATQLEEASSKLSSVSEYDENIEAALGKVDTILSSLDDVISLLETAQDNLDGDKLNDLYEFQDRLLSINTLIRKHGVDLDDVIEKSKIAEEKLEELDPENNNIETLEERLKDALELMESKAEILTKIRLTNATKLMDSVNEELVGLAMAGNKLVIECTVGRPTKSGQDNINFMLKAPGASALRPIAKAASGGELSRIMLALEVVLADPNETPTFVFDEVDSGVGGATAIEIGKRLARLAKEAQVIVVTHLPQVASFANSHLRVLKSSTDEYIETNVESLDRDERLKEIARMLSGMSESETGQAHALELLQLADEFKAIS